VIWIVPAVVILVLAPLAVLLWMGAREHRDTAAALRRVRALAAPDAKAIALRLLASGGVFQCTPATVQGALPSLPPSVAELFLRYEEVARGEFWLGRRALSEPSRKQGYLKIGEDFEFTQILTRPAGLQVFTSYGEDSDDEPLDALPTIWHKLVEVSEVRT
jgi:hypothetical protein